MKLKRRIFFKLAFCFIVAIFIVSCGDSGSSPQRSSSVAVTPDDPGVGEPDEPIVIDEPISEVNMKAVLLYDGSLKSFNDDKSISVLIDAESVVHLSDGRWVINDELRKTINGTAEKIFPANIIKACIYDGFIFAHTGSKIYKINSAGDVELFADTGGYVTAMNDNGIAFGFTFMNSDGTSEVADGSFGFWCYNEIIKLGINANYKSKSIKIDGTWKQISDGYYTGFMKYDALITDKKIVWSAGATTDLETMTTKEPYYIPSLNVYSGGNGFMKYYKKSTEQRIQPIGYSGDMAYFFYPKTGQILKYSIGSDLVTEWVTITEPTGTDDITINGNMIERTGCILVGSDIIFFDGVKIYRIDVTTGEKVEIADATEFKGIVL